MLCVCRVRILVYIQFVFNSCAARLRVSIPIKKKKHAARLGICVQSGASIPSSMSEDGNTLITCHCARSISSVSPMQHGRGVHVWQQAMHEPGVPCQIVSAAEPQATGAAGAHEWPRGRHVGLVPPRVAPQISNPHKVALANAARCARCRRTSPRPGRRGATVCRGTSREHIHIKRKRKRG